MTGSRAFIATGRTSVETQQPGHFGQTETSPLGGVTARTVLAGGDSMIKSPCATGSAASVLNFRFGGRFSDASVRVTASLPALASA